MGAVNPCLGLCGFMPVDVRAGPPEGVSRSASAYVLTFPSYRNLTTVDFGTSDAELLELTSHLRALVEVKIPSTLLVVPSGRARSAGWYLLEACDMLTHLDRAQVLPA